MPVPYGWDQTLTQQASAIGQGTTSVPSTPLQGPFYVHNMPPASAFNTGMGFPLPGVNIFQNYNDNDAVIPRCLTKPVSGNVNRDQADRKIDQGNTEGFNFVPNLDFESTFSASPTSTPNQNITLDTVVKTHKRKSSDLIQLGFDGILSSDEKEYFSLEYFDPLHRKGRSASVSSPHSVAGYFFAKPPEDTSVVSKERDAWVTFDDDFSSFLGETPMEDAPDRLIVQTLSYPPDFNEERTTTEIDKVRMWDVL